MERNNKNYELSFGIKMNSFSLVNKMIHNDVNKTDIYGNNVLNLCVFYNKFELFNKILDSFDIDINQTNVDGISLLMTSSIIGLDIFFEKIFYMNIDVNLVDNKGNSSLILAAMFSRKNILDIFLRIIVNEKDKDKKINLNLKNNKGENVLVWLCKNKLIDYVYKFIELGADPHQNTANGISILMIASKIDNVDLLQFLLKKGLDINLVSNSNDTCLKFSTKFSLTKNSIFLINNGAIIEDEIFLIACNNKLYELLDILISKNINKNVTDKNNRTSLVKSIISQDHKMIEYLIKNRVDLNLKDNFGLSALAYSCMLDDKKAINLLLNNRADVNIKDNFGNNCLMYSMHSDDLELIRDLVKYGINLNEFNFKKETPITYAFKKNKINISLFLLENGAKLNFIDGTVKELDNIYDEEFKKQILEIIKENSNIIKFNDVPKQADLNKFFNK